MNVSALTDVELNRAMIWCYPDNKYYDGHYDEYMGWNWVEDWNLTMPLAVENMAEIQNVANISDILNESYKPALRTICEVLVTIKILKGFL